MSNTFTAGLAAKSALVACLLLSAFSAMAAEKGKKQRGKPDAGKGGVSVAVAVFTGQDRDLIQEYYLKGPGALPPGLSKRGGDLPPGLQKHLQRDGRLPPGLQKRMAVFPAKLEKQLSPLVKGLKRGLIGGHAVIYNPKTSVILDVLAAF